MLEFALEAFQTAVCVLALAGMVGAYLEGHL